MHTTIDFTQKSAKLLYHKWNFQSQWLQSNVEVVKVNFHLGFPGWLSGKKSTCDSGAAGDASLIPGLGRSPGGGNGTHSSVLAGKAHGQRSLAGCSPWGRRVGHD